MSLLIMHCHKEYAEVLSFQGLPLSWSLFPAGRLCYDGNKRGPRDYCHRLLQWLHCQIWLIWLCKKNAEDRWDAWFGMTVLVDMEMSTHIITSYLDIRIHLHLNHWCNINMQLLALPVYERHTGLVMFDIASQSLDVLCPAWRGWRSRERDQISDFCPPNFRRQPPIWHEVETVWSQIRNLRIFLI